MLKYVGLHKKAFPLTSNKRKGPDERCEINVVLLDNLNIENSSTVLVPVVLFRDFDKEVHSDLEPKVAVMGCLEKK